MSVPQARHRPTQLVVVDSTFTVQAQDLEIEKVPEVDKTAIFDFQERNNESRSVRYLSSLDLSVPVVLVSRHTLESFLHNGPEPYWEEFYRRYPGSNGSISFSSIGYSTDGHLAVLVVDQGCVLLGKGDGTFQSRRDFLAGGNPLHVAAADLNADGHQDFIVGSERTDGCIVCGGPLTLYLGKGDGSFSEQFRLGNENGPFATGICAVDLNADGRLDLAMSDAPNDALLILMRNVNIGTVNSSRSDNASVSGAWITDVYPVPQALTPGRHLTKELEPPGARGASAAVHRLVPTPSRRRN